jgi:hypothetical protein
MQRNRIQLTALAGAILLVAGVASPVRAQYPPPQNQPPQNQPPNQAPNQPSNQPPNQEDMQRGVARISIMDGQVSVRRGDAGEWVAGVINAPLMADDSVATAPNSRAEVQFDSADMLRIGGNAEVHLTALENNRYQMELVRGSITFRVLRPSNANIEVDTPSISVRPSKIGVYRIAVNDAGESELTVRAGDVEVFSPKGSQSVNAGQTMRARGAAADPEFQIGAAIPPDDWDRWSDSRDQALMQASAAYQNVPPGVYGVEDMQNNGVWTEVPNYGNVWHPTTVAPGWSPYSCGRWVWEDWYGWTWVGCETWGWAPYHYGRWFYEAGYGGWLWYPGMIGVRHYWSPALVAFFGFGPGVGFGFGFGNVGWVALAPFEVFRPWWGAGFYGAGFAGRVNIGSINVGGAYRNARVLNGVSGVSAANFRGGQFGGNIIHASGEQLRTAGLVRGQMPIGPSSANLRYSGAAAFTPRAGGATSFFTHQQPGAVQHMAVTQAFRGAGQTGREAAPASRPGAGAGTQFGGARSGAPAAARPDQNGASGGWSRFGTPAAQQSGPAGAARPEGGAVRGGQNPALQNTRPGQSGSSNGWRGFGAPSNGSPSASRPQSAPGAQGRQGYNSAPAGQGRQGYNNAPARTAPQGGERQSAPSNNAPRSAPSNSAPRPSGGGSSGGRPSGSTGHSGGNVVHRR